MGADNGGRIGVRPARLKPVGLRLVHPRTFACDGEMHSGGHVFEALLACLSEDN